MGRQSILNSFGRLDAQGGLSFATNGGAVYKQNGFRKHTNRRMHDSKQVSYRNRNVPTKNSRKNDTTSPQDYYQDTGHYQQDESVTHRQHFLMQGNCRCNC